MICMLKKEPALRALNRNGVALYEAIQKVTVIYVGGKPQSPRYYPSRPAHSSYHVFTPSSHGLVLTHRKITRARNTHLPFPLRAAPLLLKRESR